MLRERAFKISHPIETIAARHANISGSIRRQQTLWRRVTEKQGQLESSDSINGFRSLHFYSYGFLVQSCKRP